MAPGTAESTGHPRPANPTGHSQLSARTGQNGAFGRWPVACIGSRHPRHGTPPLSLAAPLREAPLLIQNGGEARGAPPAGQRELTAAGLNGTEVRWARRRRLPPRGGYVCYINKGNGRVGRQRRRRTDSSAARQVACAAAPATRSPERVSGFGSPRRSPRETRDKQ